MELRKCLRILSALCQSLELIAMVIGFSSPYWIQSIVERNTGFVRMGLWEACFDNYAFPQNPLGQRHDGCYWIFHYTYREVWKYINPPWFLAMQIMLTLCVIMQMITIMFVLFYVLHCCPTLKERTYVRASHVMNFICFLFIGISTMMFGVKADTDRQWLPHPDSNFLSWSFGFCVLSGFFALFAALCLLVEDIRLGEEARRDRRSAYQMKSAPRM